MPPARVSFVRRQTHTDGARSCLCLCGGLYMLGPGSSFLYSIAHSGISPAQTPDNPAAVSFLLLFSFFHVFSWTWVALCQFKFYSRNWEGTFTPQGSSDGDRWTIRHPLSCFSTQVDLRLQVMPGGGTEQPGSSLKLLFHGHNVTHQCGRRCPRDACAPGLCRLK